MLVNFYCLDAKHSMGGGAVTYFSLREETLDIFRERMLDDGWLPKTIVRFEIERSEAYRLISRPWPNKPLDDILAFIRDGKEAISHDSSNSDSSSNKAKSISGV